MPPSHSLLQVEISVLIGTCRPGWNAVTSARPPRGIHCSSPGLSSFFAPWLQPDYTSPLLELVGAVLPHCQEFQGDSSTVRNRPFPTRLFWNVTICSAPNSFSHVSLLIQQTCSRGLCSVPSFLPLKSILQQGRADVQTNMRYSWSSDSGSALYFEQ